MIMATIVKFNININILSSFKSPDHHYMIMMTMGMNMTMTMTMMMMKMRTVVRMMTWSPSPMSPAVFPRLPPWTVFKKSSSCSLKCFQQHSDNFPFLHNPQTFLLVCSHRQLIAAQLASEKSEIIDKSRKNLILKTASNIWAVLKVKVWENYDDILRLKLVASMQETVT